MGQFNYLKKPHADVAGRDRTITTFEKIETAFPDWGGCKIAETYRGWLDDNGIEAETDTGWLHQDGAANEVVERFIAQQKQEGGQ